MTHRLALALTLLRTRLYMRAALNVPMHAPNTAKSHLYRQTSHPRLTDILVTNRDADGRMGLHAVSETVPTHHDPPNPPFVAYFDPSPHAAAVKVNRQAEMTDALVSAGGDVNVLTEDGRSPLLCAVEASRSTLHTGWVTETSERR